jgi:prepilin peptidase CpaA
MNEFTAVPSANGQAIAVGGLLAVLLIAAAWHDVRRRRIPNVVVFCGAGLALALHAALPAGIGLLDSAAGLAVGLAALMPLYLLRATGAGDVKLMAMVGAFAGPGDALGAVLCTFAAGALLALAVAVKAGVLRQTAYNVKVIVYATALRLASVPGPVFDARTDSAARMPYAVAIAAGTFGFLALKHFG